MSFFSKIRDQIKTGLAPGEYARIFKVAYPLVILSASNSIMQFVDRQFLAFNSTEDVAAAMPGGITYFTLFCFFLVTVNFTNALVAQFYGAGNISSCIRTCWTSFYFALATGIVIVFALPWIGGLVIASGGHAPEIVVRELEYFHALGPSGAFMCLGAAFFAFFSGRGKTVYVATVNTIACALNILLDYLMIFGHWGFPKLGILGAGLATSLASVFSFLCILLIFLNCDQQRFPTRKYRSFRPEYLKKLFSFGTPAGIQVFFDVGAFTMVLFLIGHIGNTALAATTISLAINQIVFLPLLGFSDATSIVCGQFIGMGELESARRSACRAWHLAALYMVIAGIVYLVMPEPLLELFRPRNKSGIEFGEILKNGAVILALAAFYNFFDATKFIFMGALRGAGDTRILMVIAISFSWGIMVPGVLLTIFVFHGTLIAVWIFLSLYVVLEAMIMFWRFRSGRWQKINMIERRKFSSEVLVSPNEPVI
ncbi:MAG: MATE family efflux transporter [Victivallales bacterium]|nr:MATE family efflux transporter [Victivallales bacterium]